MSLTVNVTTGMSLIWVTIYGVFIIYIYGLVGFVFYRPYFDKDMGLYCDTIYECVLTLAHWGIVDSAANVRVTPARYRGSCLQGSATSTNSL